MAEEVTSETIKKTQKLLGKHIKKPPLTDKLLKKPPFRFLHDLISNVIKETGLLKGLFSEEELQSENIKEKDAKIAFLNKLIDAIKSLTKSNLNVRATKIVAGLEPANTNLLLQAIGKALDSKIDSTEYVKHLNSGELQPSSDKKPEKKGAATKEVKKKSKEKEGASKLSKNRQLSEETPKSKRGAPSDSPRTKNDKNNTKKDSSRRATEKDKVLDKQIKDSARKETGKTHKPTKEKTKISEKLIENIENSIKPASKVIEETKDTLEIKEKESEKFETPPNIPAETISNEPPLISDFNEIDNKFESNVKENIKNDIVIENVNKNVVRPKSARPKSGEKEKIREKHLAADKDEQAKPLEMTVKQALQRPKSSLRPPSVRPSSARPGAPRLRPDSALPLQEPVTMGNVKVIIENIDPGDDEETVVVENAPEIVEESAETSELSLKNKGHLVEQILEKIKEGDDVKKNVDIDWESNAVPNKDGTKEISQLRNFIQNVTKTANPLGKLLNYLHEDIDAMHSEYQMWSNTKKQLLGEIQKQKRLTAESNKPLLSQLEQLQQDIKKQQQEIINVQSNIIRNDLRIKELLSK